MSYAAVVREFAEAQARKIVFKTPIPIQYQRYGQTAYSYNKSTESFRRAIDKLVPGLVEEFKQQRIVELQAELEQLMKERIGQND